MIDVIIAQGNAANDIPMSEAINIIVPNSVLDRNVRGIHEANEQETRAVASLLLGKLEAEQENGNHPAAQTGRHEFTFKQVHDEMLRDPRVIWNGEKFVIRVDS